MVTRSAKNTQPLRWQSWFDLSRFSKICDFKKYIFLWCFRYWMKKQSLCNETMCGQFLGRIFSCLQHLKAEKAKPQGLLGRLVFNTQLLPSYFSVSSSMIPHWPQLCCSWLRSFACLLFLQHLVCVQGQSCRSRMRTQTLMLKVASNMARPAFVFLLKCRKLPEQVEATVN